MPVPRSPVLRVLPLLLSALLAFACQRDAGQAPERDLQAAIEPDRVELVGAEGALAAEREAEREAAREALPETLVARGRLDAVPNRLSGRFIEALLPTGDGAVLVATSTVRPPHGEVALYRVEGTSIEHLQEPVSEEALAIGRVRSTRPRLVALSGRGIALLQSLDFLAEAEKERALLQWWVPVDRPVFDGPDLVPLPDGLRLGREVSAAAVGAHVVVCFSALIGEEDVEDDHVRRIACGLLDPAAVGWVAEPVVIHEAAEGRPIAQLDLAGGGEHGAFLIWAEDSDDGWTARGAILREEDGAIAVTRTGDLAGEQLATGQSSFVWGNTPLASVGPERVAYYLPRVGDQPARGGQLSTDGERVGPRHQLPSWPQPGEKALLFARGDDHVMLFDALGREGERTIAVFSDEGITTLDYWTPLDTPEHAAMARLGHAENGHVAFVHDSGERLPGVVSIFAIEDLFASPGSERDGARALAEERIRAQEEEKLRVARERMDEAPAEDAATEEGSPDGPAVEGRGE